MFRCWLLCCISKKGSCWQMIEFSRVGVYDCFTLCALSRARPSKYINDSRFIDGRGGLNIIVRVRNLGIYLIILSIWIITRSMSRIHRPTGSILIIIIEWVLVMISIILLIVMTVISYMVILLIDRLRSINSIFLPGSIVLRSTTISHIKLWLPIIKK